MYDRTYNGKILNFEPSGGLINSSLVMQDFETDSYWAIMNGESIAGEFKGTKLVELPFGKKMQWRQWVARHPETLVLSVRGREDGADNYSNYFSSNQGFRGSQAKDKRLQTKESIFAFNFGDQNYAVPHSVIEGGRVFSVGKNAIFLFRPPGSSKFYSTLAYIAINKEFEKEDGDWVHSASGCRFETSTELFAGGKQPCPVRLERGFDTFWYNWSLNNPGTIILGTGSR